MHINAKILQFKRTQETSNAPHKTGKEAQPKLLNILGLIQYQLYGKRLIPKAWFPAKLEVRIARMASKNYCV